MRPMQKFTALCLALCLCCVMGGCGYQELYERLLIHGIGVDREEDGFLVTVRSSASTEDEGEECFQGRGKSVLEALGNLSLDTGREPFYAHNYLVVFGRECAQEGLDQCLDFFVRYYNTRPAVQLYLARGRAEEILQSEQDGKLLKMSELQQLGKSGRYNGKTVDVELLDFINGVKREGSSPILPVLEAAEAGPRAAGAAYFDGFRLKGFLTPEECRGYLAAGEGLEKSEIVVDSREFGAVTLSLSGGASQIRADWSGGTPVFRLEVQVKADLSALPGSRDLLGDGFYQDMEQALSQELRQTVEHVLEKVVLEDRCDIFGFGNLLYQRYPGEWKSRGRDWKELIARCRYEVRVASKLQRLEQETLPGAL